MRKFFYFLGILFLGGILVYQGFFYHTGMKKPSFDSLDFNDKPAIFQLTENQDDIEQKLLSNKEQEILPKDSIVFEKIAMVDGVYRDAGTMITVQKNTGKSTDITLPTGNFVFAINNLFDTYTIHGADIIIQPKSPGYFFIQNTPGNVRVYSYNSILSIDLLTAKKSVTNFHLFPSLLFVYNPQLNNNLQRADILRIATIDSISFVSSQESNALLKITGGSGNTDKNIIHLLQFSQRHIKKQLSQYQFLFEDLIKNRSSTLNGSDLIASYPFLFINDSKKDIFLKNTLAQELSNIFEFEKNPDQNQSVSTAELTNTIQSFKQASPATIQEGIAILKIYSQISFLANKSTFGGKGLLSEDVFTSALKDLDPSFQSGDKILSELSGIFLLRQFSDESTNAGFEKSFNTYLASIIQNQQGFRQEFSYFSFFLSQYIITDAPLDTSIFSVVSNFITITNIAYDTLQNPIARKTYLDAALFNYDSINKQLKEKLVNIFFTSIDKGMVIKDEFLASYKVEQNIIDMDSFKSYVSQLSQDLDQKKSLFYQQGRQPQLGVRDLYVLAQDSADSVKNIYDIFDDYSTYRQNLELDPLNRAASRLSLDSSKPILSLDSLKAYLSQFHGLDINTLRVTNNFLTDNYYAVQVTIADNAFSFHLDPDGNVIDQIKIFNPNGQLIPSENLSVSLDEKEKWLKDLYGGETDPAKKYQYDFKNFFLVTYLSSPAISSSSDDSQTTRDMTPQMKVFVQQNLLDGDFKIFSNFLPIPATSIYSTITDGEYHTELTDIPKFFPGKNDGYQTELSGFYVFAKHAFYKLFMRVKDENSGYRFGGTSIEIIPNYINARDLEITIGSLGKYLDVITENYVAGGGNIKIDLNSKSVSIDSVSFGVTY